METTTNWQDRQLTKEEAIAFAKSEAWKDWNDEQICRFQLFQRLMCVPFDRFHEAVEKTLGRPVFTHEFGLNYDGIVEEYLGTRKAPTLQEIIEMIPAEKRLVIAI